MFYRVFKEIYIIHTLGHCILKIETKVSYYYLVTYAK